MPLYIHYPLNYIQSPVINFMGFFCVAKVLQKLYLKLITN